MLALFILIKPGIQVKRVEHAAPSHLDERDVQLGEQCDPDPEVRRRLFSRQTPRDGQRQAVLVHVSSRRRPCDRRGPAGPWRLPGVSLPRPDR